jgi:predicted ATPase
MIESIEFVNFKALRNATLPLAPFTLLLGPNGSGKSSVLQALQGIAGIIAQCRPNLNSANDTHASPPAWIAAPSARTVASPVEIKFRVRDDINGKVEFRWSMPPNRVLIHQELENGKVVLDPASRMAFFEKLGKIQTYSLDPTMIAMPVPVNSVPMGANGNGLVAVLDDLKDNYPERWEMLLAEFREWLPEYDHIQFNKPQEGRKSLALRTNNGGHRIPANELSQGTLVALALLTLAYLPNPPYLIGLEEIDRGLHPRLLRHLQDALYRLSYPDSCGEKRPPIQVIATTHSPYLLDLYREHPEVVVVAQKEGLEVQFKQVSKVEHFDEIIGNARLGDMWYSGFRRRGGEAMKIGYFSESPADQAALAVFAEGILGEPPEPANMVLEGFGVMSVLGELDGVFRGAHYGSDADALVVVVD